MFSINDDRVKFLRKTLKERIEERKVHNESAAYALIGQRCAFCRTMIKKEDVTPPNMCYESQNGDAAHKDCIMYVQKKYPNLPITDLRGKIQRIKVDLVKSEL